MKNEEVEQLVEKVSNVIKDNFSKKYVFQVTTENYEKFKHLRALVSAHGYISDTIKDGDIVKVLDTPNVRKYNPNAINTLFSIKLTPHILNYWKRGLGVSADFSNFHGVNYFYEDLVKATDEEIKFYNTLEEAKRKYPVGIIYHPINYKSCKSDGRFCVDAFGNIFNRNNKVVYHKSSNRWAELKGTPEIFIDGHKGEFFPEYVKFGCAEIDKEVFINLSYNLSHKWKFSNRDIEYVTIGNGIFSKEHIKQIANYYTT